MTQVNIPQPLAQRIQDRLPQTDFKSVDEYVSYILDSVLAELDEGEEKKQKKSKVFSDEDQKVVEDRLRSLGYM